MSEDLFQFLADVPVPTRRFGAGAFLFHRGDPVRVLHQVVEGTVNLIRHHEAGGTIILQRAVSGSFLAEASFFADRYHCDAIAVTATRTRAVRKGDIHSRLTENPELALAWAAHLAREVQTARLRAEILSLKTVAERLDAWIAANDRGLPDRGTWTEVAAQIGTSREALYRELAKRRRD